MAAPRSPSGWAWDAEEHSRCRFCSVALPHQTVCLPRAVSVFMATHGFDSDAVTSTKNCSWRPRPRPEPKPKPR